MYVCVADVPDAPKTVMMTELKSPRNVSLSWVPGSDHNSSVTGTVEVHVEGVGLQLKIIFIID